jgi:aminopeptidase N
MFSLTYDEAKARAAVVRNLRYDLDFDLTRGESFRTTTVVRFDVEDPEGVEVFLEARPIRLISATLNGVPVKGFADGRLPLDGLADSNEVVVIAEYEYSHTGEGLHRYVDPADDNVYIYAQPAVADAPRFMACFDQPDLKAAFTIRATADPSWTVRSNAAGTQTSEGRWEFEPTKPISTYLITLIAGAYAEVRDEHDGIPLALYARASYADDLQTNAPELFEVTKAALDRYHDLFGIRLPFGKYEQAFVPEFTWGAMEFPGLVVHRDEYIYRTAVTDTERARRAYIVAHEMAHMWFGDLVTMRWWDDLWLNESFATYMGYRVTAEVTRFTGAWTDFAIERKLWGYGADQRPSTHPVAPEHVADTESAFANFDGISYAKGCAALRQLVAWLGDEPFFTGLRAHFHKHAWGNATLADLLAALSAASGRDLSAWADKWLRSAQVNTLRPVVATAADGRIESLAVEQTAPADHPTLRPHRIGVGYTDAAGERRRVEVDPDGALTTLHELDGVVARDLLLNDGDLTFAKIRFDGAADPVRMLGSLESSLDRAVVWSALWDSTRDGEVPAAEFLDVVAAALPTESEVALIETVLAYSRMAVNRFLPPQARDAAHAVVSRACQEILDRAAPGSGVQLAAARMLVSGGPADPALLADWLAGRNVPEGIDVDADLRWTLLLRQVVQGGAGEAEIDAELAIDNTARGATEAARCRAAIPTAAAKEAAYALLMTDRELSNRILEAIGDGLWQPERPELTDGFVERYFTDLAASQEWRSGQLVGLLGSRAYPVYSAYDSTVEAAEALLAQPDLNAQLVRSIIDATDDLRRSIKQQTLWIDSARGSSGKSSPADRTPGGSGKPSPADRTPGGSGKPSPAR